MIRSKDNQNIDWMFDSRYDMPTCLWEQRGGNKKTANWINLNKQKRWQWLVSLKTRPAKLKVCCTVCLGNNCIEKEKCDLGALINELTSAVKNKKKNEKKWGRAVKGKRLSPSAHQVYRRLLMLLLNNNWKKTMRKGLWHTIKMKCFKWHALK